MASAERDAEALKLRVGGHTLAEIAAKLGYCDEKHAHKAIKRRIEALPAASADEYRRVWSERLDLAAKGLLAKVKLGHTASVDSLVKVADRDAKLKGLDAKQEVELTLRTQQLEGLAPEALLRRIREQRAKLNDAEAQLLEEHPELRRVEPDGSFVGLDRSQYPQPSMLPEGSVVVAATPEEVERILNAQRKTDAANGVGSVDAIDLASEDLDE